MSPVLLALVLAQTSVSTSKLGVYVGTDISTTANDIIGACPASAVFPFDITDQNAPATLRPSVMAYLGACPRGRVILQMNTGGLTAQDILQSPYAATLVGNIQNIGLRANVDVVEIPFTIGSPIDVATYWAQLAQQLSPYYLPLLGAGTVTNFSAFCLNISQISQSFNGFGIGFQAVTPMTYSLSDSAFVFNQASLACAANGLPLTNYPMFVTQLYPASGWNQTATNWLAWYDQQIANTPLQAAAMFQLGASPDINAISPFLCNYFPNPFFPDGGFPDGGDAGSSSGVIVGPPHGSADGTLTPPKEGCATAGAGFVALAILPLLVVLRRVTRKRQGRGSTGSPRTPA